MNRPPNAPKAQRKTRGRRKFFIRRGDKTYYPPTSYTYWSEGDATFSTKRDNLGQRTPRHVKKFIRKSLSWGPWVPWWTNHNTRATAVLVPGVLR